MRIRDLFSNIRDLFSKIRDLFITMRPKKTTGAPAPAAPASLAPMIITQVINKNGTSTTIGAKLGGSGGSAAPAVFLVS